MVREALIVATGTYTDPGLRRLRSPAQDAAALSEVLADPRIGDFSVEQMIDGTEPVLRRTLHRFFSHRRRDDVLLVHFSCHGVKDDDGHLFFAATDTSMDALPVTAVPASFLNDEMERCRAQSIVLLLDCCYAGAFAPGSKGDDGVHLKEKLEGRGRAILTASNAIEYSWEGTDLSGEGRPSVFTAAVLEGLRTGDADRDRDGRVSLNELHEYITDRMLAAEPKQTPLKWELGIEGGLYIAHSPRRRSALSSDLAAAMEHSDPWVRFGAVNALVRLLDSTESAEQEDARKALAVLVHDDSLRVRTAAEEALRPADEAAEEGPLEDTDTSTHVLPVVEATVPPADDDPPSAGDLLDVAPVDDADDLDDFPLHEGGRSRGERLMERLRRPAVLSLVPVVALLVFLAAIRFPPETPPEEPTETEEPEEEQAESTLHTVRVSALETRTDTGIDLQPGDDVTINATGEICDNVELPERCFPPDGVDEPSEQHPGDPLREAQHAALLGSVDDTGLFEIGAFTRFVSTRSGRLFLSINDGRFDDNSGGFEVTVEITRS